MKKTLPLFLSLCLTTAVQAQVQPFEDGFYHATNVGTGRWIAMVDNYSDGVDARTTSYDLAALTTYRSFSNVVSNPGSVVYVKKLNGGYNLYAQGTDVYSFSGGMVLFLRPAPSSVPDAYIMYSIYKGQEGRLFDIVSSKEEGEIVTVADASNPGTGYWKILPVSQEDNNYFGVTPSVQIDNNYYHGLYTWYGYTYASEGMSAYYVTRVTEDGCAIWKPIEGNQIHGTSPVIIKCSSADASGNRLTPVYDETTGPADNLLKGVYFCHDTNRFNTQVLGPHRVVTEFNPANMRLLGKTADGKLGFVSNTDYAHSSYSKTTKETYYYVPANSCYLPVPEGTNAELPLMTEEEYPAWQEMMAVVSVKADEMPSHKGVYTLTGTRLNTTGETDGLPAGVYIVNGHKQLVK